MIIVSPSAMVIMSSASGIVSLSVPDINVQAFASCQSVEFPDDCSSAACNQEQEIAISVVKINFVVSIFITGLLKFLVFITPSWLFQ